MSIELGDYVQGLELVGDNCRVKKICGWVNRIQRRGEVTVYVIQADDNWDGARCTEVSTEYGSVNKLDFKPRPRPVRYF